MKRSVLTTGIIAGAVIAAYAYIAIAIFGDTSNITPKEMRIAEWLGYVRYLLLLAGVVIAMITYKKDMSGPISYGQAFKVGVLVSLIIAVFVGAMEYMYMAYVDPNFIDHYIKVQLEMLKQDGASAAAIEQARRKMAEYEWMRNPAATGGFYFLETAAIGTIFALISARFTHRKEQSTPGSPALNQPA